MDTEILIYRIVGLAFLICLPVALAFVILPARSQLSSKVRAGAMYFHFTNVLNHTAAASAPPWSETWDRQP